MTNSTSCDVIVIGAGPAGILAAGQAALRGKRVLLLEKMERPGRKLRITGKGRCNLTNATSIDEFIRHFGNNGRFLKPAFYGFFVDDLRELLASVGIPTIIERGNRVFPECESAVVVTEALVHWLQQSGVTIILDTGVTNLRIADGRITGVTTAGGRAYSAANVIICTGGMSYPLTGSTGDGYALAAQAGHKIIPPRPALIPLETESDIARRLQGLSLRNVSASVWVNGKKQAAEFGEMLFAHFGLTGPIILTLSGMAADALSEKAVVEIALDLKPALDYPQLDARLQRDFDEHPKQQFQKILKFLLPSSLIPVCLDFTGIPPHKNAGEITAKERQTLRNWLKDFRFRVTGHRPIGEAIITAGGVCLKEINPKTLESRRVKGLYFAGEVLDINADTGGYNLQAAFSTGWLAGNCITKHF